MYGIAVHTDSGTAAGNYIDARSANPDWDVVNPRDRAAIQHEMGHV